MVDLTILATAAHAAAEHEEPTALWLNPGGWVALAMVVVILIMLKAGVPALIAGMLDGKIAEIRKQLDEAKALRAEAEALRQEYAAKIANAEQHAADMLEHAQHEADAIIARAEAHTTTVIARREKMAQDKIAAAERSALAELRARAAAVAAAAAGVLIAENHDAKADKGLVDAAIAAL